MLPKTSMRVPHVPPTIVQTSLPFFKSVLPLPSQVIQGLKPGTNYTALLAVASQSILVGTVAVVSGILTPDTNAPTFEAVGPMQVGGLGRREALKYEWSSTLDLHVGSCRTCLKDVPQPPQIACMVPYDLSGP